MLDKLPDEILWIYLIVIGAGAGMFSFLPGMEEIQSALITWNLLVPADQALITLPNSEAGLDLPRIILLVATITGLFALLVFFRNLFKPRKKPTQEPAR